MIPAYSEPDSPAGHQSLVHAFAAMVSRAPMAVAVVDGADRVSYRDLARAAEAVRRDLVASGVGAGDHVGISMARSWRLICTMIGILAAGARYVPLDPDYPRSRLDFMVADSQLRVVCVDAGSAASSEDGLTRVPVSGRLADTVTALPAPDAPAGYVMYTSGSTGRPKGVVIPQRNVLALFAACARQFTFTEADVWTFFHSYSFDFSVWEIWGALLHGGALVVVGDDARRDPDLLLRMLRDLRVSVLSQVPTPFRYLVQAYERTRPALTSLRYLVLGGESIDKPSLRRWLTLRGGPEQLVNMYGITETTVHVTAWPVSLADTGDDSPSVIGFPLPHLRVALVDPGGSVVRDGEAGEIWISGAGLSCGYLGNPDLTAERFVHRDLGGGQRRWYRSGDLASRDAAGRLSYLGRADSQVNVRGYRIELGEIEATLREHPQVRDAVAAVTRLSGGEQLIVAVAVPADDARAPVTGQQLREFCLERLPAHLVPDRLVIGDQIPTTPGGGKVDRKAAAAIAARRAAAPL